MDLTKKRHRLATKVRAFQTQAATWFNLGDSELPDLPPDTNAFEFGEDLDVGNDGDGSNPFAPGHSTDLIWLEDGEILGEATGDAVLAANPELIKLAIPSNVIGISIGIGIGNHGPEWPSLVEQELGLRIGQANDALHSLRLNLGFKSLLFRTTVRPAKSQSKKTRAWDAIRSVNSGIQSSWRVYQSARLAMISLGASSTVMDRFQPLTKEQLIVSTAVVDPNARGQRSTHLAWFWSLESPDNDSLPAGSDTWMDKCKLASHIFPTFI